MSLEPDISKFRLAAVILSRAGKVSSKMATAPKRQKVDYKRKGGPQKKFMQVGQRGFLVTCNFREKECIKESYNLFNNYYDEPEKPASPKSDGEEEEQDDIATQLANEIKASKADARKCRFQALDTQTANCIFIEANIEDPLGLGVKIVRDIASSKVAKTRFLLRLLPVEIVCRANLVDMMNVAESLFDKHFLGAPKTYAIMFNRRYNNDINRDSVIKEFAEIIQAKNGKNRVDLKSPEFSVIVEVIKGFCCLSVVPDYLALKKYNLVELCAASSNKPELEPSTTTNVDAVPEEQEKEQVPV